MRKIKNERKIYIDVIKSLGRTHCMPLLWWWCVRCFLLQTKHSGKRIKYIETEIEMRIKCECTRIIMYHAPQPYTSAFVWLYTYITQLVLLSLYGFCPFSYSISVHHAHTHTHHFPLHHLFRALNKMMKDTKKNEFCCRFCTQLYHYFIAPFFYIMLNVFCM